MELDGRGSDQLQRGHNDTAVIVHETAEVDPTAQIGPNVVVGAGCKIEAGVRVRNATILAGTTLKAYSLITDSIIGWKSTVASWSRITDMSVLGQNVNVKEEALLKSVKILPHVVVTGTHEDKVIML
jgi:mannose-1-phosphate guanylyltransferase